MNEKMEKKKEKKRKEKCSHVTIEALLLLEIFKHHHLPNSDLKKQLLNIFKSKEGQILKLGQLIKHYIKKVLKV